MPVNIRRLLLEEGVEQYGLFSKILKNFEGIPRHSVSALDSCCRTHPLNLDKKTLHVTPFQGKFLKPCPGTKGYICCGYQILNLGTNCPYDCSYCILQDYINQPSLRVFINIEEQLEQLEVFFACHSEKIFRIGTGEFMDSLALDPHVGWSSILLPFFAKQKNAVLEMKTKSDSIDGLLGCPSRENIIVSWSLNSPGISVTEESGTPDIKKRIQAAKRCEREGFLLGFHFDPLFYSPGWKEGYLKTLEYMDKYLDPKRILWISLGCFRYTPHLKSIVRARHPASHILDGEFVPGLDGKERYFKPIRIEVYRFMVSQLRQWHREIGLYLCMESDEVWEKSLGWSPKDTNGLTQYLDDKAMAHFGLILS